MDFRGSILTAVIELKWIFTLEQSSMERQYKWLALNGVFNNRKRPSLIQIFKTKVCVHRSLFTEAS